MPFKGGQLDIAPMAIINVNIQSALTTNQSIFLVNTSMVTGKILQEMETKIDRFNKKIGQNRKDQSLKDKIVIVLQNKNKDFLAKLEKQKSEFEKSLEKIKAKIDNANQVIQDLKAQAAIMDGKKIKQVEVDLKIVVIANKVLSDDNSKLLLLIKGFKKSLVDQIGDRMVTLSHLHLLKDQIKQSIKKFTTQIDLHRLALEIPRSIVERMQSWLRALIEKDIASITPRPRQ